MKKKLQWHGYTLLFLATLPTALWAGPGEPCLTDSTPETLLLNTLWRAGTAAGNSTDWYRNMDGNHAQIQRADYPQINDYTPGFGYTSEVVDAPRIILGNASLGYSGKWSMVRKDGMGSDFYANDHYDQYRANQHYWHPSVEMKNATPSVRDYNIGMFPYISQSVGKSGSEIDEMRKFFHTLAAFRPEVKTKLEQEGLLIPTVQMIFRRTRVASDAEYLTGKAHPSAFDNTTNDVAMINMAQSIATNTIPPMINLQIIEENYGGKHPRIFNEKNVSEQQFTTPASIARVFRGTQYTKRMVVDAGASTDVNGLPLTYHFAVLRGDPAHVRITPLNAGGSKVEIQIDYHPEALDPDSNRLYNETANPKVYRMSNLVVIGAFVNNGSFYSAPGFITSYSLFNEVRTYGANHLLGEIRYIPQDVAGESLSRNHAWDKDTYSYDFNQRLSGWIRDEAGARTPYTAEGLIQNSTDSSGRPLNATDVSYSPSGDVTVIPVTNWMGQLEYAYTSLATPENTPVSQPMGVAGSAVFVDIQPDHGVASVVSNTVAHYIPEAGFTGVDIFTVQELDPALEEARIHKIRVVVGAADTVAPAAPEGLGAYGASSGEILLSWQHTTDNVEVYGYHIYRDGNLFGSSYQTTTFSDTNVTPGVTYTYTVTAFDDAGNESGTSASVNGSTATIWGQDDFEDGNFTVADPALSNGLAWTLQSGLGKIQTRTDLLPELNGKWLRTGYNGGGKVLANGTLPAPFLIKFHDAQAYVSTGMGLLFLYQDTNNYYAIEIAKDAVALRRMMDGVETTLGTAPDLRMQNALCSARFAIQVVVAGGAVVVDCTKSEWTTYSPVIQSTASQSVSWVDTNSTAAARFASGQVGFYVDLAGTFNVPQYDNILISSLDGDGPDRDANGMADAWEIGYFGDLNTPEGNPNHDSDGDRLTTLNEYIAGTDPTDPSSLFKISSMNVDAVSGLTLAWPSVSGRVYDLYFCTNLLQSVWQPRAGFTDLTATPPTNQLTLPSLEIAEPQFFQLRVRP